MAIDTDGNGIQYSHTENGVAWYGVFMKHETVMWVSVNELDYALPIILHPAEIGTGENLIVTKAHATMALHSYPKANPEFEGETEVREHVDGVSIQQYVVPRFPWLLAALETSNDTLRATIMDLVDVKEL